MKTNILLVGSKLTAAITAGAGIFSASVTPSLNANDMVAAQVTASGQPATPPITLGPIFVPAANTSTLYVLGLAGINATGSSSSALRVTVSGNQILNGDLFAPNGTANLTMSGTQTLVTCIEAGDRRVVRLFVTERGMDKLIETLTGDEATGARIVANSLEAPLRHIAANAGFEGAVKVREVADAKGSIGLNAVTGELVDLVKAGPWARQLKGHTERTYHPGAL